MKLRSVLTVQKKVRHDDVEELLFVRCEGRERIDALREELQKLRIEREKLPDHLAVGVEYVLCSRGPSLSRVLPDLNREVG